MPPAKKTATPKRTATATSATQDAQRAKQVAAARAAILKTTGKKPIAEHHGPHKVVSSGSSCIDDLIGGDLSLDKTGPKCPGYPRRRITELLGLESSGKTTAALEAIAEAQRNGGLAMFIDFEHALDHDYAKKIGVSFDEDRLILLEPDTMEEGWKMIHIGIAAGCDIIVVDSVAAMVPENELLKKKPGDAAKIGAVASSMAQNLPKVGIWLSEVRPINPEGTALVMINQLRAVIKTGPGGGGGPTENSAGGMALKFYCYLRLKFTRIGSEFIKRKNKMNGKEQSFPYGNHTQVKILKSKVDGKQGFTTDIFIRFNYGIDDFYSMIEAAAQNGVVRKGGAIYEFAGEKFQGRDKFRKHLMENPALFDIMRTKTLSVVRDDANADEVEEMINDEDAILASLNDALGADEAEADAPEVQQIDVNPEDVEEPDTESESVGA